MPDYRAVHKGETVMRHRLFATLVALVAFTLFAPVASAQEAGLSFEGFEHHKYHQPYNDLYTQVNQTLGPGDKGYRLDEFQPTYRGVYSSGKCACKSGYCRPTDTRPTELGSPTGKDILVQGVWMPVPMDSLQNEKTLTPELMQALLTGAHAHVCAYPDSSAPYGYRIECSIFYLGG